jgi:hypothetical protein
MGGTKVSAASRKPAGLLVGVVLLSAIVPAPSGAAQQNVTWFADPHPAAAQAGAGHSPTGALTTYPTRTDFLAATDGADLASEDFEGGFAPANGMRICFQAVASTSDDPCFAPGDLVAGFSIRSSGGNIWDPVTGVDRDLIVLGPGMRGIASTAVGADVPDPPQNPTQISFDGAPTAVAMDVYDSFLGQPVQIEAYDADDQLIGVFTAMPASTTTPAFAGFTSTIPVKRVAVNALASGGGELIDNLTFGGGAGHAHLQPAAPDFDAVALGRTAILPVTLSNDGSLDLHLGTIATPAAPFSIQADGCSESTLARGDSCVVELAFTPDWASNFSASLEIPGDSATPTRLTLNGQGVRARVSPLPGAIDFGPVAVGSTAGPLAVAVANLTGGALTVTGFGAVSTPFARVGGSCAAPPFDLDPGAQCTLEFSFAPASAGTFDAALTIAGSGVPATVQVNLHGIGGQP